MLEARFEADTKAARFRGVRIFGLVAAVLLGVFIITDIQLPPAVRDLAIQTRFTLCALLLLISRVLIKETTPGWARDCLCAFSILAAVSDSLLMFFVDPAPLDCAVETCGVIGIIFYGMIVLPILFRFALPVIVATTAMTMAAISCTTMPLHVQLAFQMILVVISGLIIVTAHRQEHQQRRDYLHSLLDRLRYANLLVDAASLRTLAERDGLTGLLNRRAMDAGLQMSLDFCRQNNIPLGIILMDVDHFKCFNDTHGHLAGDDCLRAVAGILAGQFRAGDLVGRFGGEEFIVVLRGQDADTCYHLAERARRAIESSVIEGSACEYAEHVTASFGVVALVPDDEAEACQLLRLADHQLYAAKRDGRNQVAMWRHAARVGSGSGKHVSS